MTAKIGVQPFWKLRVGTVAIGMQNLVAESGNEYLARLIAVVDPTGRGHSALSAHNSAQGESPSHRSGDALNGVRLGPRR